MILAVVRCLPEPSRMIVMKLAAAALLLAGSFALPAVPAAAQSQRVIEIFGNDKCPTDQGSEIVVCRRLPEQERFRIPETLRKTETERHTTGVALAETSAAVSRASSGMDNCSPVGAAGHTGCYQQSSRATRAAQKQAAQAAPEADQ